MAQSQPHRSSYHPVLQADTRSSLIATRMHILDTRTSETPPPNAIPDLPDHWKAPHYQPGHMVSYVYAALWAILCLASVSKPNLESHWRSKQTDELWREQEYMIVSRLSNCNTAAGLILATTAVFLTTTPPMYEWNYLQPVPNFLFYMALCHALMSLWFGTWLVIIYQATTRKWAVEQSRL
ncbi:hypothetical protein BU15DRAFT_61507 [Melanogaster broomeanus]|nr:hypothetical protein BU15DRAFT_61507 [Melanogaster broomeanus]